MAQPLASENRFRKLVFEQVLPSIRQHGFYATQQAAENLEMQYGDRPKGAVLRDRTKTRCYGLVR